MKKETKRTKTNGGNSQYKNRGITLIALVITIIVLLILAGISIAMLTGENGLLTKVIDAKNKTNEAQAKEKIDLAVSNIFLNGNNEVTYETLNSALNEEFGPNNYDINPKDASASEWTVTVDGVEKTVTGKAIEGEKFYVYHSSSATVTEHNIEDYKQADNSYKFDIVGLTTTNYLYGGYYSDYGKKGNYNISNPQTGTFGEAYSGDQTSWNIDNAYKTSGRNIVPIPGKTYFLKEVYRGYLRPNKINTTDSYDGNRIRQLFFFTAVDDLNYRSIGFDGLNDVDTKEFHFPCSRVWTSFKFKETKVYTIESFFSSLADKGGYLSIYSYAYRDPSEPVRNYN